MDDIFKKVQTLIDLKQKISELYLEFSNKFKEDRDFWRRLSFEENEHASILESGLMAFLPLNAFPTELIPPDSVDLEGMQTLLIEIFDRLETFDHLVVLQTALEIENSPLESFFQATLQKEVASNNLKYFQIFSPAKNDHITRIENYLKQKKGNL